MKEIKDLGLTDILYIPEFKDKMIRYVLRRVHNEFIWLDIPYMIMKEAIQDVTGLPRVGQELSKKISNTKVKKLIGVTSDSRSMRVSTITNSNIKFTSMIIGYKVTQSNHLNSIANSCIHVAHQMLRNNVKYDLCEWMRSELMLNLKISKEQRKARLDIET